MSLLSPPILYIASVMVALQSPKLTVGVRVPGGMPILSRIRLAAMPPGLGPGFRRFESFMRDQFYTALDFWEILSPSS